MRRLISDTCLFVLLPIWLLLGVAQAQFNSFPPGVFNNKAALDPASGGGYTGQGDITTFSSWWGLRAYSAATSGNKVANVCNTTPTCADINSLANGNFDVATAQAGTTNCGGAGGQCTVATLYDQVSTLNLVQATSGMQPLLIFSAVGGKACFQNNSGNHYHQSSASKTQAQPFAFTAVSERTSGTSANYIFASNNNDVGIGAVAANTAVLFGSFGSAAITVTSVADNSFHDIIGTFNGTTPNSILTVDGADSTGTTVNTMAGTVSNFSDGGSDVFLGYICENGFIAAAPNGTIRTNLANNMKNYYGYR